MVGEEVGGGGGSALPRGPSIASSRRSPSAPGHALSTRWRIPEPERVKTASCGGFYGAHRRSELRYRRSLAFQSAVMYAKEDLLHFLSGQFALFKQSTGERFQMVFMALYYRLCLSL